MANYKQKIIAFALVLFVSVFSNPLITFAEDVRPAYSKGDLDGSGVIDSMDCLIWKRISLKNYSPKAEQLYAADVNGDGEIDSVDYLCLKRHILGNYDLEAATMKEQIPLTDEQTEQIKEDFAVYLEKEEPGHYANPTPNDIIVGRYYGPYSGCYLIFIDHREVTFPDEITTKTITGYQFVFSNGQMPRIYKDGAFYSLEEAYETGLITKEDVYDLSWYFK